MVHVEPQYFGQGKTEFGQGILCLLEGGHPVGVLVQ